MIITAVVKGFGEMQRRVDIGHEDTRLQTCDIVTLNGGCVACLPCASSLLESLLESSGIALLFNLILSVYKFDFILA